MRGTTKEMQVIHGVRSAKSERLGVVKVQKSRRTAVFECAAALVAEPNRALHRCGDVAIKGLKKYL